VFLTCKLILDYGENCRGFPWQFSVRHQPIAISLTVNRVHRKVSAELDYTYLNDTRLCLRLHTSIQSKSKAETLCQSEGLLNTDTQERLNAAVTLMKGASITTLYIDGQRTVAGGSWSFTNGVDPEKNGVPDNWLTGEPSNRSPELWKVLSDHHQNGTYAWCDRKCDKTYEFICEIRS